MTITLSIEIRNGENARSMMTPPAAIGCMPTVVDGVHLVYAVECLVLGISVLLDFLAAVEHAVHVKCTVRRPRRVVGVFGDPPGRQEINGGQQGDGQTGPSIMTGRFWRIRMGGFIIAYPASIVDGQTGRQTYRPAGQG